MTIAVDFDGTLFTDAYPDIGKPIYKIINWCKKQKKNGHVLILWTCRENEFLNDAVLACKLAGLTFDYINENNPELVKKYGFNSRKIGADIYIDDKARRKI